MFKKYKTLPSLKKLVKILDKGLTSLGKEVSGVLPLLKNDIIQALTDDSPVEDIVPLLISFNAAHQTLSLVVSLTDSATEGAFSKTKIGRTWSSLLHEMDEFIAPVVDATMINIEGLSEGPLGFGVEFEAEDDDTPEYYVLPFPPGDPTSNK